MFVDLEHGVQMHVRLKAALLGDGCSTFKGATVGGDVDEVGHKSKRSSAVGNPGKIVSIAIMSRSFKKLTPV